MLKVGRDHDRADTEQMVGSATTPLKPKEGLNGPRIFLGVGNWVISPSTCRRQVRLLGMTQRTVPGNVFPLPKPYQRNPKVTGTIPTVPVPMLLVELVGEFTQT